LLLTIWLTDIASNIGADGFLPGSFYASDELVAAQTPFVTLDDSSCEVCASRQALQATRVSSPALLELFTDPSQGRNTPINRLNYLLPLIVIQAMSSPDSQD
jgi:hypothetical protein